MSKIDTTPDEIEPQYHCTPLILPEEEPKPVFVEDDELVEDSSIPS